MEEKMKVLKGDITRVEADAIVNAANSSLMGGGGVDGAIHRAGGPEILKECKQIVARQGRCATSEAVITTAGRLPAKWVIHTVGPVWYGGHKGERDLLARCYKNSLQLAADHDCATVAFPNISTGVYHFPKPEAAKIAVKTVRDFLEERTKAPKVIFVCFDDENFQLISNELKTLRL